MDILFTDRARKVMQLANQRAKQQQHDFIGTEHILLGIVNEGGGVAAFVLRKLGVRLEDLAAKVEQIQQADPKTRMPAKRPYTPRSKEAIELAISASSELGHDYVGTEHILLGLLKEERGFAGELLRQFVTYEDVLIELQEIGIDPPAEAVAIPRGRFQCGLASLFVLTVIVAVVVWLVQPLRLLVGLIVGFAAWMGLAVGMLAFRDRCRNSRKKVIG